MCVDQMVRHDCSIQAPYDGLGRGSYSSKNPEMSRPSKNASHNYFSPPEEQQAPIQEPVRVILQGEDGWRKHSVKKDSPSWHIM